MPASSTLAEGLARTTAAMYAALEARLLVLIAQRVNRGLDTSDLQAKLAEAVAVRAAVQRMLDQLTGPAERTVRQVLAEAWARGGTAALADLARLPGRSRPGPAPFATAVLDRLIHETVQVVQVAHAAILRSTVDAYRQVVAEVAAGTLGGIETRRQTAQRALNRLAVRGITGFIDRAGRSWDMASYVEMAVRTATGRAAVAGHTAKLAAAGRRLVIVSDAPQECALCRPWEGAVLAISGPTGLLRLPHATRDGVTVTVAVKGTVAEAQAAGLQHPNCRHSLSIFLPGVTRIPTGTADPQGDRDRQRLRALERQVRAWKRREAVALDPHERARARRGVTAAQGRIREHVATTGAKRQPQRERIGAAR